MRHEEFMKQKGSPEDYPPSAERHHRGVGSPWPDLAAEHDMVNSPPHYNQTGIECIHAISAATGAGFKYYLQGNIMKYLWRFDYKDKPLEDLKKAQWYLDKLIEEVMADAS